MNGNILDAWAAERPVCRVRCHRRGCQDAQA